MGTAKPHPRISVTESHILPAIMGEADRLATPDELEQETGDADKRADLQRRRLAIADNYESGAYGSDPATARTERDRRIAAIDAEAMRLDARRLVSAIPGRIDWETWTPRAINGVLRALWREVTLDTVTFQPTGFDWTIPEWRRK
jgi:hypothetical protein